MNDLAPSAREIMSLFLLLRQKQRVSLVFDGVDTVSTISLNDVIVGTTDNMFRRYVSYEVTGSSALPQRLI